MVNTTGCITGDKGDQIYAFMAEMVNARVCKTPPFEVPGSSPGGRTKFKHECEVSEPACINPGKH